MYKASKWSAWSKLLDKLVVLDLLHAFWYIIRLINIYFPLQGMVHVFSHEIWSSGFWDVHLFISWSSLYWTALYVLKLQSFDHKTYSI